jgi:hypothetical protein
MRRLAILGTGTVAGLVVGGVAARRRWHHWGATPAEQGRTYLGDDPWPSRPIRSRRSPSTPPPERVWPWLADGAGAVEAVSYDWLENLFGLDIHTTDEIREEWQHLEPGDRVVVVPAGRLGMPDGYSFPVAEVEEGHHLVLRQAPPEHPWDAVWTFVVEPDDATPDLLDAASDCGVLVLVDVSGIDDPRRRPAAAGVAGWFVEGRGWRPKRPADRVGPPIVSAPRPWALGWATGDERDLP